MHFKIKFKIKLTWERRRKTEEAERSGREEEKRASEEAADGDRGQ